MIVAMVICRCGTEHQVNCSAPCMNTFMSFSLTPGENISSSLCSGVGLPIDQGWGGVGWDGGDLALIKWKKVC